MTKTQQSFISLIFKT